MRLLYTASQTRFIACALLLILLAACGDATTERTLEANYQAAGTRVADIRTTGTVQTARLQTTLDYVSTRSVLAATQSGFLKATLNSRGTPMQSLLAYQNQIMGVRTPTRTPTPGASPTPRPLIIGGQRASDPDLNMERSQAGITTTPTLLPGTPTQPGVTPLADLVTATPERIPTTFSSPAPDQPRLVDPRLGTQIGANSDCVDNPQTTFTPDTAEIYISVQVENAPAGTEFVSRWLLNGDEIITHSYTPDFPIDGRCIWFFVDQTEITFTPGNWTVEMLINGQPVLEPQPFTIVDPASS